MRNAGDLSGTITVLDAAERLRRITEANVAERILEHACVPNGIATASGREGVRVVCTRRRA